MKDSENYQNGSVRPGNCRDGNGQPIFYQDANVKPEGNGKAAASLVMGILSLLSFCTCLGGIVFGILAICFALISKLDGKMKGEAKAGLILGIIGFILTLLVWGAFLIYIIAYQEAEVISVTPDFDQYSPELNNLLTIFSKVRI